MGQGHYGSQYQSAMKRAPRYVVSSPRQFGKLIENDVAQWTKVIEDAEIPIN